MSANQQSKSKNSSSSSSSKDKIKMSFLKPHPVIRMVKSHDLVESSSSKSNKDESDLPPPLSNSKWYHNLRNMPSATSSVGSTDGSKRSVSRSRDTLSPCSPSAKTPSSNAAFSPKNTSPSSKTAGRTKSMEASSSSPIGEKLRFAFNLRSSWKLESGRKSGINTSISLLQMQNHIQDYKSLLSYERLLYAKTYDLPIEFDVSDEKIDALRKVRHLQAEFVANVLVPKSKYLGRLTFRKLRKKSTTVSLEREQRKTCDLTKEALRIEEIVNNANYNNRTWIYKPNQQNEENVDGLSVEKPNQPNDLSPCGGGSGEQSGGGASNCLWVHKDGTLSLNIPKTPLFSLTEAEIITLQKLAVICLRSVNFNCSIIIPREYPNQSSGCKTGHYSRWNQIRKLSGSKTPDSKDVGNRVFGVPLGSLVRNQNKENFPVLQSNGALDAAGCDGDRQPSPSGGHSRSPDHKKKAARRRTGADAINPNEGENFAKLKNYLLVEEEHFEALSSASLLSSSYGDLVTSSTTTGFRKLSQMALDSPNTEFRARGPSFSSIYSILARSATSLVDALTLSSETSDQQSDVISSNKSSSAELESAKYSVPTEPCVPPFVKSCIEFIRNHNGLHTVGIFRIAGSQKRIKSLREEFDTYGDIDWVSQSSATVHDVAALMKCFLRELPDGLLSKELYQPLIDTTKLDDHKLQLKCLKYLLCLLPRANRDTLHCIVSFLSEIHQATTAEQGPNASPEMSGSKMNAANLATVFGPTLLKPPSSKTASHSDITVEKMEYIEDYTPIVYITQTLILCHQELFQLDGTTTSKVLQIIQETNPEATDFIIYQRYGKLADGATSMTSPKPSSERKPSGDVTRVSIKRSHHTPRSLSCCRHSMKQARDRFFEEPAYTATRTQPATPLIGLPNSEAETNKSDTTLTISSNDNNLDAVGQSDGVNKAEVGTYTRKFRSNRSVGMAKTSLN